MHDEAAEVVSLSELLGRSRTVTGASSLTGVHSETNETRRPSDVSTASMTPPSQYPNPKFLKPLKQRTILIGTLSLPIQNSSPSNSNLQTSHTSCFSFSDGSATVCCDILDLDPGIIGKEIYIGAWNFIPLKCGGGFLEIIRWSLQESSTELSRCPSSTVTFPIVSSSSIDSRDRSRAHYYIHGPVASVSPVSVVPCKVAVSSSPIVSGANSLGQRNVCGFLTQILVCDCKLCNSKDCDLALKRLCDDRHSHCFIKPVIVYFNGLASSWHPVMCRLIGSVVTISSLKKKLVFIGKEESKLMYVTTEKALLQLPKLPKQWLPIQTSDVRGNGELGAYTGIVTGVYMQSMIVELDQKVLLLLTDEQVNVSHSLRIGAIVSIMNVHFINPKFSWTEAFILGACPKTSIRVDSFSPVESRCHLHVQSQSRLGKFINSLGFAARLWVLLVISSFRKKFTGILTEKEILGSKNKAGFAQSYASSCLPLSLFRFRHGIFTEYCKNGSCGCGADASDGSLKLVVPISNFLSYCKAMWHKVLSKRVKDSDIGGKSNQCSSGDGRPSCQSIRKTFSSEDIAVILLGRLKVSPSSGRLQLMDTTGGIDIVISDLTSTWNVNGIYEVNSFVVVMEGISEPVDHGEVISDEPFSCRSMFNNISGMTETKFSLYLRCFLRDQKLKNNPFYPDGVDWKRNLEELESGRFHLLCVTHKSPMLQKVISSKASAFVEAVILSWDLFLPGKEGNTLPTETPEENVKVSSKNIDCGKYRELVAHKRLKVEMNSSVDPRCGSVNAHHVKHSHQYNCSFAIDRSLSEQNCSDSSYPCEIPCLATSSCFSDLPQASTGILRCSKGNPMVGFHCKPGQRKVFLEFDSKNLCKYESLKIGRYYMLKHHSKDELCTIKDSIVANGGRVVIRSRTHLWSLSFSFDKFVFPDSFISRKIPPRGWHNVELPLQRFNGESPQICSDIHLFLSSDVARLQVVNLNVLEEGSIKSVLPFEEFSTISRCNGTLVDSSPEDLAVASSLLNIVPVDTVPATLISEIMEAGMSKPMHINCRVVAVYILVMEKKDRDVLRSHRRLGSGKSGINIPLAAFILDDGSSSCCCWASNERALALLKLHEEIPSQAFLRGALSSNKTKNKAFDSTFAHLRKIVEQYGRVVMKNFGSLFDSSCQDFTFYVGSDKIICSSDQDRLKFIILNACFNFHWTVEGCLMDSNVVGRLVKELAEVEMRLHPLKNILATKVYHESPLNEARNIMQQLINK